ncbi:MAG: shikimate kinase, partial [Myxococcota bacterium]|nr:shikimate kinase [Myxococcota bacterium]
ALLTGIARTVKNHRNRQKLTAGALAEKANLSRRFLAEVERGTANISIVRLNTLARALDLSLAELVLEATRQQECIALLGIRGAGKSTIGQALAAELNREFIELDTVIEGQAGFSLTEIFTLHGEDYYRRTEAECLNAILQNKRGAVIALSGGVTGNITAYERILSECLTVWLKAEPEDYMQRVLAQGDHRPMAHRENAMAELRALAAKREPQYQRATLTIDTTSLSLAAITEHIRQAIR